MIRLWNCPDDMPSLDEAIKLGFRLGQVCTWHCGQLTWCSVLINELRWRMAEVKFARTNIRISGSPVCFLVNSSSTAVSCGYVTWPGIIKTTGRGICVRIELV